MAVIGPRPALWNQYDLLAERDKYGANDVRPGLTGLAQIHGRDELEIPVKAKLDGDYVAHITFWGDVKCFMDTIGVVLRHDGVVEGGNGHPAPCSSTRTDPAPFAQANGYTQLGCERLAMITIDELKVQLAEYGKAVQDLEDALAIDASKKRVQELEHAMTRPGFYDDAEASKKVFDEVGDLKGKLGRFEKLQGLYEDARPCC